MSEAQNQGPRDRFRRLDSLATGLGGTLMFNLACRVVVAVVTLVATPLYLHLLGHDAYGLVGLWVVAQSWMVIFDPGIAPVVGREISRFRAGSVEGGDAASVLRAAEVVFLTVGGAVAAGFFLAAPWVAKHWLGPSKLDPNVAIISLRLTGALLVCRWVAGLYQASLVGLERQKLMNAINVSGATLRSAGSIAAMLVLSPTPVVFFAVQAGGGLIEAGISRVALFRYAPKAAIGIRRGGRLLAGQLRFAGAMMVSAVIATVVGEVDKLILSHRLSLPDFGLFSLVVSVCAGIGMIAPPFVQVMQPRLTILLAQGKRLQFVRTYRLAQAAMIALVGGLAGVIAAHPSAVLLTWTNDPAAARVSFVLSLYALGTGFWSLLFLPFLIQFAYGKMNLNLWVSVIYGVFQIPIEIFATIKYGALGAGIVWLSGNIIFLLILSTLVIRKFLSRDERRGLLSEAVVSCAAMAGALWASNFILVPQNRIGALISLGVLSAIVIAVGAGSSDLMRREITLRLSKTANRTERG